MRDDEDMEQDPQPKFDSQVATDNASPRFQRQRERILDSATLSLNRNGVWGMTLQGVAASLGMQTSSVTYYFKKREHLTVAVFDDTLTRLSDMVHQAATEAGPPRRVARFIDLYLAQHASALRGEGRPLAVLAEIRAMDDGTRPALVARYQEIFRAVRGFFGPIDNDQRRDLLTARAHILIEALFWADLWLPHFPIEQFPSVGTRMLDLFDGGIAREPQRWRAAPVDPGDDLGDSARRDYIRTATRMINEHGHKGASVQRITRELHRAKTHLYRYNENKDDLFAACVRASAHRLATIGRQAVERHPQYAEQIAHIVSSVLTLQFTGDFPLLRASALQAMPHALRLGAIERFERLAFGLMGSLVGAMQEGSLRILDPFIAAQVLLSAMDSSFDLRRWRRAMAPDRAVSIYMDVLAGGLFDPDERALT